MKLSVFGIVALYLYTLNACASATSRPIVGVLAQEISRSYARKLHQSNATSYISASYVKAAEASGARVVPIFIKRSLQYYRRIMSSINGLILPGGDVDLSAPAGFAAAAKQLLQIAVQFNDAGDYFPIFGVCQGYELLMFLENNNNHDILTKCECNNVNLPLNFKKDFMSSKLFRDAPKPIVNILQTLPVTSNHHSFCVTEENLRKYRLDLDWRVMSTNDDVHNLTFISTSESRRYPFFGVQFHPEKNAYEWRPSQNNPHSRKAIVSARYFYDWFIQEASKSDHRFVSADDENRALIYTYSPVYTGRYDGYNEQCYFF